MRAFSYAGKPHRSMCYRSRLLINKFNARGSGYVLERRFAKFIEITQYDGHYTVQGHLMSPTDGHFKRLRQLCPSPSLHPNLSTIRLILEPTTYYRKNDVRNVDTEN